MVAGTNPSPKVILNGFVKALPKTKAGLYGAVIISSFIFGFIHVMWDVSSIPVNPLPVFVQIISKTVYAGALGMLLAAVYLKTKNIWTAVIIHTLYDYFLFLATVFGKLGNATISAQYVDAGVIMNQQMLLTHAFRFLLAVPNIIIAVLVLRKLEPAECVIWK